METNSKSELPAIEATFDTRTPEYYAAWEKCRELATQLSQALAETGDNEFAYIRPAGSPYVVCFGALAPSAVDRAIEAHHAALKEADAHWSKVFEAEETIEDQVPFVRVRIGSTRRMDQEPLITWAYDEEDVMEKTKNHIRLALNEAQRKNFELFRDKKLEELRELEAQRHAVRETVGLNALEATGRELDNKHRGLFEVLKQTKPATICEAQTKIRYIADHLDALGEAMDEDAATALIRALV
ncbi:MAG: hypothetical protein ACK4P4_09120 [Allorhizobium sp.]